VAIRDLGAIRQCGGRLFLSRAIEEGDIDSAAVSRSASGAGPTRYFGHVDAYAGLVALDDEMLADVARALRAL
jgi:hypothetical protein